MGQSYTGSDATVTIFITARLSAAFMQLLFEDGYYLRVMSLKSHSHQQWLDKVHTSDTVTIVRYTAS